MIKFTAGVILANILFKYDLVTPYSLAVISATVLFLIIILRKL